MTTNVDELQLRGLLLSHTVTETAEILRVSKSTIDRAKKIYGITRSYTQLLDRIELTEHEEKIVYGTVLGDGHLESRSKEYNPYLRIEHGSKQKSYVLWKYHQLKRLTSRKGIKCSKAKNSWYFQTKCLLDFKRIDNLFYPNGEKVLPSNFEHFINKMSLAVWYLDDGTKSKKQNVCELTVQGYSYLDIGRIIGTLKSKFGYECKPIVRFDRKYSKPTTNIRFTSDGTRKFLTDISPCVYEIEDMRYKLYPCNDYVRTTLAD